MGHFVIWYKQNVRIAGDRSNCGKTQRKSLAKNVKNQKNDKNRKWHMADFSHQLYLSLKKYQYEYPPINSDFFYKKE